MEDKNLERPFSTKALRAGREATIVEKKMSAIVQETSETKITGEKKGQLGQVVKERRDEKGERCEAKRSVVNRGLTCEVF